MSNGKGPLITRSELRKRREEMERQGEDFPEVTPTRMNEKQLEEAHRRQEKKIDDFYRKENKKNKSVNKSRAGELQKSRDWNAFLTRSIIIVALLIVIVMLFTFFL